MASLPEIPNYDAGVFQLETDTPVKGGADGPSNAPLRNLANRTAYLKQHVDALEQSASSGIGLDSPHFTGTPTTPDADWGDYSDRLANTQFVQDAIGGVLSKSVGGQGNFVLTQQEAGHAVFLLTGALTGNVNVVVPTTPYTREWLVVNRTTGNFSVTVRTAAGSGVPIAQGKQGGVTIILGNVVRCETDFESALLGANALGVTAPRGTDDQRLATTQWVNQRGHKFVWGGILQGNVALTKDQVGSVFYIGTGGANITLPKLSDTKPGETFTFHLLEDAYSIFTKNAAEGALPLKAGGNFFDSVNVKRGNLFTLTNILGAWWAIGGDAGAPFSKGSWGDWHTNSYDSSNNGMLENFGQTGYLAPGQTALISFAMAYPQQVVALDTQYVNGGGFGGAGIVEGSVSLTGFQIRNDGSASARYYWRARGF